MVWEPSKRGGRGRNAQEVDEHASLGATAANADESSFYNVNEAESSTSGSTALQNGNVHSDDDFETGENEDSAPSTQCDSIRLWGKQYEAVKKVIDGKSIFITGPAGTGKSHVVNTLSQIVRDVKGDGVALTAPTGIAACNIGGMTIHSWAGVGICKGGIAEIFSKVKQDKNAQKRWRSTKILFIDEVSMLSAGMFDTLSKIGRRLRGRDEPFGGIQLVLSGDFFQLPPVNKEGENGGFLFNSSEFKKLIANENTIVLDKVFRQSNSYFLKILHEYNKFDMLDRYLQSLESITCCEPSLLRYSKSVISKYEQNRIPGGNSNSVDIRPYLSKNTFFGAKRHIDFHSCVQRIVIPSNYEKL